MKKIFLSSLAFFITAATFAQINPEVVKPRVIVMTDGEIDDRSSMVRFLLYTNDVDVAAIIQTNSVHQLKGRSVEKWLEKEIDAYGQVYPNLIVHDPSYPSAEELRSKVYLGDEDTAHLVVSKMSITRIPGMKPAIDPAGWHDTPGSDRIVEILLENDPRPVYIQAWGGGNTAARAFYKLKTKYPSEYERSVSKVIMYNVWYQDGAGNYIEKYHPKVTMLLSHYFFKTWAYGGQSFTYHFIEHDIQHNHGPLGALYPQGYVSEGDSPSFLYSLPNGLRSNENPAYGGWGGRFYKVEGFDNVYRDIDEGSYSRWIEFVNRDFQSRMKWCVAKKNGDANHRPVVRITGKLNKTVRSGERVELEAEVTDADSVRLSDLLPRYPFLIDQEKEVGKEELSRIVAEWPKFDVLWWQFKEAGTYDGMVLIADQNVAKTQFIAPKVDKPTTIHIILQATDRGVPALTAFARVIITVVPK